MTKRPAYLIIRTHDYLPFEVGLDKYTIEKILLDEEAAMVECDRLNEEDSASTYEVITSRLYT